ncbi:hypothetical protein LEP1GSC070_2697 [Leptospira santarosai str. AIM]|nr:hypothetical protein LEP1GSC070_2697 [Leptospira santarosai str. AIM]
MRALHPILRHSSGTEDAHTATQNGKIFIHSPSKNAGSNSY